MHIDAAPSVSVPGSALPCEVTISTKDNSHEPVVLQLHSFVRGTFEQFWYDCFTIPSHGMPREEFLQWWEKENPSFDYNKELAIYYYRKTCVQK